jgi:hypothetical protein
MKYFKATKIKASRLNNAKLKFNLKKGATQKFKYLIKALGVIILNHWTILFVLNLKEPI